MLVFGPACLWIEVEAKAVLGTVGQRLTDLEISSPTTHAVVALDHLLLCRRQPGLGAMVSVTQPCQSWCVLDGASAGPCRLAPEKRPAIRSPNSGPEIDALACMKPCSPTDASAFTSGLKVGARLEMLIAPAAEFLPDSVPCGQRSTSTCSMAEKSDAAVAGRPL